MNRFRPLVRFFGLVLVSLASPWLILAPARAAAEERSAAAEQMEGMLYVTSTAHLDTQWNWTIQDTITKHIPSTLNGNFALFDKFPDYVFSFEGAFRYMLMKEYYPEEYARLRKEIEAGRWRVTGSSVDAGDVNVPSPESLIRHVLYGNGFFRKEFGKTSLDIFLPDCFGFGYALPSVAAHCGLKGFSSQKLSWGPAEPVPFDVGVWEGPDGASIVAVLNPGPYTARIRKDLSRDDYWTTRILAMKQERGFGLQMKYFGVGDVGGAPDAESVEWLMKSVNGTGSLRVASAGADQIFRDLTAERIAKLPRHKGELLMSIHGVGCYTSQSALKRWNRRNELLADAAERAAVAAHWTGALEYPKGILDAAWIRFLWHQFHDDLTGTSIPQAYRFSWNDHALSENQFTQVLDAASGAVIRGLDTQARGVPVVVFNPLAVERLDVVEARLKFPRGAPKAVRVYDPDGHEVPSQADLPAGDTLRVVFLAKVPSVGWAAYDLRPSDTPSPLPNELKVSESILENSRYVVRINKDGDVASVRDKTLGKELLKAPARLAMLADTSDVWPAWEIRYEDVAAPPKAYVGGPAAIRVVENGPARVALEITRHAAGSTFAQRISLGAGDAGDRVEFDTRIDWKTTGTLLKAEFPLTATNATATYDLGLGVIERPTNTKDKYEVPAQQWADLTDADGSFGVAILNDSRHGWDKPDDHTLRLTLLHTPRVGKSYTYQNRQDIGLHRVQYALRGHKGDWREESVPRSASRLNQPLLAWQTESHEGRFGKTLSLLRTNNPDVAVRALKQAEDGNGFVVRLQETAGRDAKSVSVAFASPVVSAAELTGAEESIGAVRVQDGKIRFDIGPFQPRTFSIQVEPLPMRYAGPVSSPLPLTYNLDGLSNEANKADGNFDGTGLTYPAELLPTTLDNCGISYRLGSGRDGRPNFIACKGQHIALPKTNKRARLYLLAAAVDGDVEAAFGVDGNPVRLTIQDFSQPVAQWDNLLVNGLFTPDIARLNRGYRKPAPVAWIGTHHHRRDGSNAPYEFCYLFQYVLDLPAGARSLDLPNNDRVRVAAITVAANPNAESRLVSPRDVDLYAFPRIEPSGGPFLDSMTVSLRGDVAESVVRYTLDGSIPDENSPPYVAPITFSRDTTVLARAFVPGADWPVVSRAVFERTDPRPADTPGTTEPGLRYAYYEGKWDALPDFASLKPVKSGATTDITPDICQKNEFFGVDYTGYLEVRRPGIYQFHLTSDDGSRLWIGDRMLIDHDGLHGASTNSASIALAPGKHALRVEWFQKGVDFALSLEYEGPGIARQKVPASALFHKPAASE